MTFLRFRFCTAMKMISIKVHLSSPYTSSAILLTGYETAIFLGFRFVRYGRFSASIWWPWAYSLLWFSTAIWWLLSKLITTTMEIVRNWIK
jgi:hypothetical protein